MKKYLFPAMVWLFLPGLMFAQTYALGDVNHSSGIDIVDALMTAQFYVGLNPGGFYSTEADVNDNGRIEIVDALYIAQFYVGLISSFPGQVQPTIPPVQMGMSGYATQNGGTTGGAGGTTVTVTTSGEFKDYVGSHDAYIVQVQGTIDLGSQVYVRENKTIIGLGSNAAITGGLKITHYNNLILRNLTIRSSNNDGLTIQDSRNVWVDHCTFIDSSDGSLDIVHASDWVTVSWCKFYYTTDHGHNFVNLIGHDDDNASEDSGTLHVTFHHNWWSRLSVERMPSVRYGKVHLYNNYFNAPGNHYCIRTRIDAEVLAENNYFENVNNPWERYVTEAGGTPGKLRAEGNIEVNTTWYVNPEPNDGNQSFLIPGDDTVFTPPYSYSPEAAATVKNNVMNNAGLKGYGRLNPDWGSRPHSGPAPDETGTITISVSVLGDGINSALTKTLQLEVNGPGDAMMYNFRLEAVLSSRGAGQIANALPPPGSYEAGTYVAARATPDEGNIFSGWYDDPTGGNLISPDNPYIFPLVMDTALHARFEYEAGFAVTRTVLDAAFYMHYCPGGTFLTGRDDNKGDTSVSSFWIAETEVTYELWAAIYNWAVNGHGYSFANAGRQGGASTPGPVGTNQHPVTTINWRDAMVWTNALTEYFIQEKRLPLKCVYIDDVGQVIKNATDANGSQCDAAIADRKANGFRLPTHPEWECAARWQGNEPAFEAALERGGLYWTPGNYISGATADSNNPAATQAACWYAMNSGGSTHAVGAKPVSGNILGLFDVSGNVSEWSFTPTRAERRLLGGGWNRNSYYQSVGYLYFFYPDYEDNNLGFRLARTP